MFSNKCFVAFSTLVVIMGFFLTGNLVFAEDKSSLEIHNDVIYGGNQEQKQYEYYENKADLFLEKKEEQNEDFKKQEKQHLDELTDKMFQNKWNQEETDTSSKDSLFQSNYSVPEFVTNNSEDTSDSFLKVFLGGLLLLGAILILFIGWKLGRVFSNFQRHNKEWS